MKTSLQILLVLCAAMVACKDEPVTKNCGTLATVRDLTGLDGCGFVFELSDGTRLIPVWDVYYCGTPPLPKEVTEDPLYNFEYLDGKKVTIGYEARSNNPTTCMGGEPARITCLEEINPEK